MARVGNLGLGTLIAVCTFGGVVIFAAVNGQQMFSPGPLSSTNRRAIVRADVQSHAQLGSNCAACHVAPWGTGVMADRCFDCHTDIRAAIETKQPMHGKLQEPMACRSCHVEHRGHRALLTLNLDQFDHDCARFQLTGKHEAVACAACHKADVYRGTPRTCVGCHAEPAKHKGRFGLDCARCHTAHDWTADKTQLAAGFDHDLTGFKLTGKHRTVACASCHKTESYKPTAQTCVSCHAEPASHKGEFGLNCASCHNTQSWLDATFRHTFPLGHANATKKGGCAICHVTPNQPAEYTCAGCHRHEPNNTAKKHLKLGIVDVKNCAVCHPAGRRRKLASVGDAPFESCPSRHESAFGLGQMLRVLAESRRPMARSTIQPTRARSERANDAPVTHINADVTSFTSTAVRTPFSLSAFPTRFAHRPSFDRPQLVTPRFEKGGLP